MSSKSKHSAKARYKRSVFYKKKCEACGWNPPIDNCIDVHHIIPAMAGGNHEVSNLMGLCPNCHQLLHSLYGYGSCKWRKDAPKTREETKRVLLENITGEAESKFVQGIIEDEL